MTIKILMLLQARSLISSDRLSVGSLVTFFLYQKPMSQSLRVKLTQILMFKWWNIYRMPVIDSLFLSQELLFCYGDVVSTMGVISKVFSYIDRTPQYKKAGDLAPERLRGTIAFQNVTFSYPSSPPGGSVLKVTV